MLACLIAWSRAANFRDRLGVAVLAGTLAAIATNVSYWNWYGFPLSYTLAYITTQIIAFTAAGAVVAATLRKAGPA
jgi:hypothetical protein